MRKISWILLYMVLYLFYSCQRTDRIEPRKEMTVVIYMAAENSLSSFAWDDLEELCRATHAIPEEANVVVYIDSSNGDNGGLPVIYRLTDRKGLTIWHQFKSEHSSTDSTQFVNNLQLILEHFPADKYGLVLWSHGSAWLPTLPDSEQAAPVRYSFGIDNDQNSLQNKGTRLSLTGLKWALDQLPPMKYIFFDACYMQAIEVAYQLKDNAEYIVGSPAEIPGKGAPYDIVLADLVSGDMPKLVEHYYTQYEGNDGVVLSCLKTDRLWELAIQLSRVIPWLHAERKEQEFWMVQHYASYNDVSFYRPDFYDLRSSVYHYYLNNQISEQVYEYTDSLIVSCIAAFQASNVWTVASNTTFHQMIDKEHSCGVSWFVPTIAYGNPFDPKTDMDCHFRLYLDFFHQLDWFKDSGWSRTGW